MGVTVAYRGQLADLSRIEDFEDRLIDLALEVKGLARIWRTQADGPRERVVRGVILDLAPGLESTSMLLSPEGWLIGLVDIEDAENGRLTEPPWCFTKTQFGPLEAHVALVEMLAALRREFLPDLEVNDEGGYWETREVAELARRRSLIQQGLEALTEGLQRHGLSREAMEDPEILLRRIERIAAGVQRVLQRPAEHPPVTLPEDDLGVEDPDEDETRWEEMYKEERRRQERLLRALEERRNRGEEPEEAFKNALGDLGLEVPMKEPGSEGEPGSEDEEEPVAGTADEEGADAEESGAAGEEEAPFGGRSKRHPLLERATDLLFSMEKVFRDAGPEHLPSLETLFQGAGDMVGGLVQGLAGLDEYGPDTYGLQITQLKRALRGAAFAIGALFPLRPTLTPEQVEEFFSTLRQLEQDIFQEIARVRAEREERGW